MRSTNPFDNPEIAANYEQWYQSKGEKAAKQEKALLECLIHKVGDSQTILEVGCGTGYFTHWFETLNLYSVGLDYSSRMIREAQENHNFHFVWGDALALPFPVGSFDLVALITSLEFIPEPFEAILEALRVARRGIILGVINKNSLLGRRYQRKGGRIWGAAQLFSTRELIQNLRKVLPQNAEIITRTTLWPFFPGSSKLPWGGFIGMAVLLPWEAGK